MLQNSTLGLALAWLAACACRRVIRSSMTHGSLDVAFALLSPERHLHMLFCDKYVEQSKRLGSSRNNDQGVGCMCARGSVGAWHAEQLITAMYNAGVLGSAHIRAQHAGPTIALHRTT